MFPPVKRKPTVLPPLPQRAAKMLARLRRVRGMSDGEKSVHALGLAATPEERWQLIQNHLRLFSCSARSKRNA
jgi:hypothetical protein